MADNSRNRLYEGSNSRVKLIIFILVAIASVILITVLVTQLISEERICPNSDELFYLNETGDGGTCYKEYSTGPCSGNLVVVPLINNKSVGACDCNSKNSERVMVFHNGSNECYFLFQQAYCASGYWLAATERNGPECIKNQCESKPSQDNEEREEKVQLKDGRCVTLGDYDPVTSSKGQVVRFWKNFIYASCKPPALQGAHIGRISKPGCQLGHYNSRIGCQPSFSFD